MLPVSRNTDYEAGSPVKSADLDEFQFQIILARGMPTWIPVSPERWSASVIDQGAAVALAFRPDADLNAPQAYRYAIAHGASKTIYRSLDGISWLANADTGDWAGVGHHRAFFYSQVAGLWIVSANIGSTDEIVTAADIVGAWTPRVDPSPVDGGRGGMAENDSLIVMARLSILTSPDGITWTARANPTGTDLTAVAWSPDLGLFVAVGFFGVVASSPDGITWTARVSNVPENLNDVVWDAKNARFIACGDDSQVITSQDGITWVDRSLAASITEDFTALAANDGGDVYMTSDDYVLVTHDAGLNWVVTRRPGNVSAPRIAFADDRPVVFGGGVGTAFGIALGMRATLNPLVIQP